MLKKKLLIGFLASIGLLILLFFIIFFLPQRKGGASPRTILQFLLAEIKIGADLYYEEYGQYVISDTSSCEQKDSIFSSDWFQAQLHYFKTNKKFKVTKILCHATPQTWAVSIEFKDGGYAGELISWCADNLGFLGQGISQTTGLCAGQNSNNIN